MPSQYDLMKGRNDGARGENAHALDVRAQNEYARALFLLLEP